MRTGFQCTFVLLCCVAASALLRAQNTLPPQAQAELDRGLAAAEEKQWDLAIKHFAEAQNTARTNPQILFNLGLAHDKAGHELAALAWLQAYLAAAPRAPNADAIRKEIARLDIATEAKINTLAKLAIDSANKLPGPSGDKAYVLGYLAEVYEAIGDFHAAYAAWLAYQPKGRARALRDHAISLAASGDMDGAASTASQIPARLLIAAEEVPVALKKRLNQVRDLETQLKRHADQQDMLNMGRSQDKAGHELAALAWLHAYLAAQPTAADAAEARQQLARLEAAIEAGIHALVNSAMDTANRMPSSEDRKQMRAYANMSYACTGDLKTALALRKEFLPRKEAYVWGDYAQSLAKSGDFEGAVQAAGHIPDSLRGLVEDDLNPGFCRQLDLDPKAPANPNRYWNYVWTAVADFYLGLPLEDNALARQAIRQFRLPDEHEEIALRPYRDALEKAEHENRKPRPPVERWVEFAEQLTGAADLVDLRASWKLPVKDNATRHAINAADAPCKQMDLLNKIRALDRQVARPQAGPAAAAGVAP